MDSVDQAEGDGKEMGGEIRLTNHSEQRIEQRCGKKIPNNIAEKAFEHGLRHSEAVGALKKYMDYLFLKEGIANNIRIYNEKVYIFNDVTLITVLNLPHQFCKVANQLLKKKKE